MKSERIKRARDLLMKDEVSLVTGVSLEEYLILKDYARELEEKVVAFTNDVLDVPKPIKLIQVKCYYGDGSHSEFLIGDSVHDYGQKKEEGE